jgi:hypothetical protein
VKVQPDLVVVTLCRSLPPPAETGNMALAIL